jgi:hypothetical protein
MRIWLGLTISIMVCFAAAGIGGGFTGSSLSEWYAALTMT